MFLLLLFFPSFCLAYNGSGPAWLSQKSYQAQQQKQEALKQKQQLFLKNRQKSQQSLQQQKQDRERAYLLELASLFDKDQQSQVAVSSSAEIAYMEHQKRNWAVQKLRTRAFLEYKQQYKAYQKKQKKRVSSRLKKREILKQQTTPFYVPVF